MTSKQEIYAHQQIKILSDNVSIDGALTINGVGYVPATPPTAKEFAWVQLAGMRDVTTSTGFVLTSSLGATALAQGQWAQVGTAPGDGIFTDSGTAAYTIKKTTTGITFNAVTGQLTFQIPGFYGIFYNVVVARTSGAASQSHTFIAAIGGNGAQPNESFGGGSAAELNIITNASGGCHTEIINPGDTRRIWLYHDHVGGSNAANVDIYALNLMFWQIN